MTTTLITYYVFKLKNALNFLKAGPLITKEEILSGPTYRRYVAEANSERKDVGEKRFTGSFLLGIDGGDGWETL